MKQGVVVGVLRHEVHVCGGRDGSRVGETSEVEEEVGQNDGYRTKDLVDQSEVWPGGGEVEVFRNREEEKEEDEHRGMAVIHYEVVGAGCVARYATGGETLVYRREEVG